MIKMFGERLKQLRKEKKVSQKTLADAAVAGQLHVLTLEELQQKQDDSGGGDDGAGDDEGELKGAASLFAVFLALFHLYLSFMS